MMQLNASAVLAALVILGVSGDSVAAVKLDDFKEKNETRIEEENIPFASSLARNLLRTANDEVGENATVRVITDYFPKDKLAYYKQIGSDIDGFIGGIEGSEYLDAGYFGEDVATNNDGTIIVVAAPAYDPYYSDGANRGAYVYQFKDDKWTEYGTLPKYSRITRVSMSDDGKHIGILIKQNFYYGSYVIRYSLDESSDEQVTWKMVGKSIAPCRFLYEDENTYPGYYYYGCGEYYFYLDYARSIKFTPDGRRLVIGAKETLVLDYNDDLDDWELVGDQIAGTDSFGKDTSISDDGNRVVIEEEIHAQMYELENNKWVKLGSPTPAETEYIIGIDTNADCNRVATVSNKGEIHIYQFEMLTGLWSPLGSALKGFLQVSMSKDGNHIAVGNSDGAGYVERFDYNIEKEEWLQVGDTIRGEYKGDRSGSGLAISGNGERVIVGAPKNDDGGLDAGSVRAFELDYFQKIHIVTNYDFNGEGKVWCLEPKKIKKNKPLQARPCNSGNKKQVWFHDDLNRLRLFESPGLCAIKKRRALKVGDCNDKNTADDAIFKFDSNIGSIFIEKPMGRLRFGIDMKKNWKRKVVRLYSLASTNPSIDTWSFDNLS